MKQPKIGLFGQVYEVRKIEWKDGKIDCIAFEYPNGESNIAVQSKYIDYGHGRKKLIEPITHPSEDFIIAPSLKGLLI